MNYDEEEEKKRKKERKKNETWSFFNGYISLFFFFKYVYHRTVLYLCSVAKPRRVVVCATTSAICSWSQIHQEKHLPTSNCWIALDSVRCFALSPTDYANILIMLVITSSRYTVILITDFFFILPLWPISKYNIKEGYCTRGSLDKGGLGLLGFGVL